MTTLGKSQRVLVPLTSHSKENGDGQVRGMDVAPWGEFQLETCGDGYTQCICT